jgi:hypothetical protein
MVISLRYFCALGYRFELRHKLKTIAGANWVSKLGWVAK